MKPFTCLLLIALVATLAKADIRGWAFPVGSTKFANKLFQRLNPSIVWDPSNFLVDLSGQYITCSRRGQNGLFRVTQTTKAGGSIGGLVDTTHASGTWADAAAADIRTVLPTWLNRVPFRGQIKKARRFGCSVSPDCSGRTVVGCLFSPAFNDTDTDTDQPVYSTTREPGTDQPVPTRAPGTKYTSQNALAFTKNQREIVENLLGTTWDKSHFLENLSGFETKCAMVGTKNWPFTTARSVAAERGKRIKGLYGARVATGTIDDDIRALLTPFGNIHARQIGCSVILYCPLNGRRYRVVSCIYQE